MESEIKYEIKPVDELPDSAFRGIKAPYKEIIANVCNKPVGIYEIMLKDDFGNVPPRKPNTVYIGLKEASKGVKGIRVHKRKKQVFVQKLP